VLIADTGPLVATAGRADRDHVACRELLESDEGPLVTTAMVIAEAALNRRHFAVVRPRHAGAFELLP